MTLHKAVPTDEMSVTRLKMKEDAKKNVQDTAQVVAVEDSATGIVEQSLKNGTETNAESSKSMLLHIATEKENLKDSEILQNKGINDKKLQECTLLYKTANSERMSIVKLLPNNKAVNVKLEADKLALIKTACFLDKEVTGKLQRESDYTALLTAIYFGYILQILFNKIPEVNTHSEVSATILMLAAYSGHVPVVERLLNDGADINTQSRNGNTPLMLAAFSGHTSVVKLLLSKGATVNLHRKSGDTALHLAASTGHMRTVEQLLNDGANINAQTKDGDTPLMKAVSSGHLPVVRILLQKGANVKLKRKSGITALFLAANFGQTSILELLLSKDPEISAQIENGDTALMVAARLGHVSTVELLISKGADINARSEEGDTTLMAASRFGHLSTVELLLTKGAKLNAYSEDGDTPLIDAACYGHTDVVQLLLSKGADMELQTKSGETALHLAVIFEQISIVKLLLNSGAKVDTQNKAGFTPLMKAYKNLSIVKLLINKGADVNARSKNGGTPLMVASRFGFLSTVELLLDKGAEINAQTENGETPLMQAVFSGNIDVVEFLLKKRANVKSQLKSYSGDTALHVAAGFGHTSIVELLLSYGAKVDPEEKFLRSPLMLAACYSYLPVVKCLLDKGANVNLQALNGDTALHVAAISGNVTVVKLILDNGGDINLQTKNGYTALHRAAWAGDESIVDLLIKEGAEVNVQSKAGYSPLYEAVRSGMTSIAKLLLENGADVNSFCVNGTTPLHIAVRNNNSHLITLLINNGANVMLRNKKGDTALNQALIFGLDKKILSFMRQAKNKMDNCIFTECNVNHILCDSNIPKSKLQPITTDPSGLPGQLYETKMLSLVFIRVLSHEQIEYDLYLGTNIDGIGAMDDICLRYRVRGEQKPVVLFMQLKHREDPGKGKLTDSSLWKDSGDFSFLKYFESYLKIKKLFQVSNKDPMFEREFDDVDCYFILYTSAKDNLSSIKKVVENKNNNFDIIINTEQTSKPFQYNYNDSDINRLLNLGVETFIKKNKEDVLPHLDLSDYNAQNAKDFFKRLWFYSGQAKQDGVERKIMEEISTHYNNESATMHLKLETHCKSIFLRSHENVQKWWKQKGKEASYLTRSDDFFKHAKKAYLDEVWIHIFNAINCLKICLDVKFLQYNNCKPLATPDAFNSILGRLLTMIDTENILITVDKYVRHKVLNFLLWDNHLQNASKVFNSNFESPISSKCQENDASFKYSKRFGTSEICGVLLRTKMMCLAFLRMLHHEEIKQDPSPLLGSKTCGIGVMNDICLRYRLKDQEKPVVVFLHLKHAEDSKIELTDEILWDESSDYSFQKHFASFVNIKEKFRTENKESIFSGEICNVDCHYGLYTSAKESILKKKFDDNMSNVVLNIINTEKNTKPFRYKFDETDINLLCSSLVANHKGKLVNTFLEYLNNSKKYNSNLLTDRVIARYHVVMAQEVLRPCDQQPDINKYRLWQFRSEFFSKHKEHLVNLKDMFFKNIKSDSDRNALKSLRMKLPLSFGNLDMIFSENKNKAQKRINTLVDELVYLLKQYMDTKIIEIGDDDIALEKTIKQKTFDFNGGIGSAVGNLLVYDTVTNKLKFNLVNEALPHNAASVLRALKDDKHKPFNKNLSGYRLNINIYGFPKTTFEDDKYEKIQAIDFLSNFWFFCDQAQEADIECILKKEINEIYSNINIRYSLNSRCNISNYISTSSHNETQKLWIQEREPYLNRASELFERAELEYISNLLQTVINYMYLFDIYNISIKMKQSNKDKFERVDTVLRKLIIKLFKSFNPKFNKSIYFCPEYMSKSNFETSELCLTIHPQMAWVALIMSQTFKNLTYHVVARADPRGGMGEFRLDEFITAKYGHCYRNCFEVNDTNWNLLYNEEQPLLVDESLRRSSSSHPSIQQLNDPIDYSYTISCVPPHLEHRILTQNGDHTLTQGLTSTYD